MMSLPVLLSGYAEGADAGVSGVPGESSCTACHRSSGGSGSVSVTFPNGASYSPGTKQHLIVTITDSAQKRWGFQLAARQASSNSAQAGSFTPGSDGYTQLACTQTTFQTESFGNSCPSSMPLQYIEHTSRGSRNGTRGPVTFEFDWTPPATNVGNINIFVNGNAANGDGTENGDHIYSAKYTLTPAQPPPSGPTPTISDSGVVNGANFQPGITAGSWVTIRGTNLANSSRTWRTDEIVNGALPTQLDGVSVTIDGKPAYVYYISSTQINVQAPSDSAQGPVSVQVNNNGTSCSAATAQLQSVSPAFFLWSGKYAVATRPDYSLVGPSDLFPGSSTPAKPGDVIILWGTGFGPTNPAVPAGILSPSDQVASAVNTPVVTIGNVPATVYGAALAPGFAGLYQLAVQAPNGLAAGDQPVSVQVNGIASATGVFINVTQ